MLEFQKVGKVILKKNVTKKQLEYELYERIKELEHDLSAFVCGLTLQREEDNLVLLYKVESDRKVSIKHMTDYLLALVKRHFSDYEVVNNA